MCPVVHYGAKIIGNALCGHDRRVGDFKVILKSCNELKKAAGN